MSWCKVKKQDVKNRLDKIAQDVEQLHSETITSNMTNKAIVYISNLKVIKNLNKVIKNVFGNITIVDNTKLQVPFNNTSLNRIEQSITNNQEQIFFQTNKDNKKVNEKLNEELLAKLEKAGVRIFKGFESSEANLLLEKFTYEYNKKHGKKLTLEDYKKLGLINAMAVINPLDKDGNPILQDNKMALFYDELGGLTIPEEYAHFIMVGIKENNKEDFDKLSDLIVKHPMFSEVVEEYKDIYSSGQFRDLAIMETASKLMAERNYDKSTFEGNLINTIKEFIRNLLSKFSTNMQQVNELNELLDKYINVSIKVDPTSNIKFTDLKNKTNNLKEVLKRQIGILKTRRSNIFKKVLDMSITEYQEVSNFVSNKDVIYIPTTELFDEKGNITTFEPKKKAYIKINNKLIKVILGYNKKKEEIVYLNSTIHNNVVYVYDKGLQEVSLSEFKSMARKVTVANYDIPKLKKNISKWEQNKSDYHKLVDKTEKNFKELMYEDGIITFLEKMSDEYSEIVNQTMTSEDKVQELSVYFQLYSEQFDILDEIRKELSPELLSALEEAEKQMKKISELIESEAFKVIENLDILGLTDKVEESVIQKILKNSNKLVDLSFLTPSGYNSKLISYVKNYLSQSRQEVNQQVIELQKLLPEDLSDAFTENGFLKSGIDWHEFEVEKKEAQDKIRSVYGLPQSRAERYEILRKYDQQPELTFKFARKLEITIPINRDGSPSITTPSQLYSYYWRKWFEANTKFNKTYATNEMLYTLGNNLVDKNVITKDELFDYNIKDLRTLLINNNYLTQKTYNHLISPKSKAKDFLNALKNTNRDKVNQWYYHNIGGSNLNDLNYKNMYFKGNFVTPSSKYEYSIDPKVKEKILIIRNITRKLYRKVNPNFQQYKVDMLPQVNQSFTQRLNSKNINFKDQYTSQQDDNQVDVNLFEPQLRFQSHPLNQVENLSTDLNYTYMMLWENLIAYETKMKQLPVLHSFLIQEQVNTETNRVPFRVKSGRAKQLQSVLSSYLGADGTNWEALGVNWDKVGDKMTNYTRAVSLIANAPALITGGVKGNLDFLKEASAGVFFNNNNKNYAYKNIGKDIVNWAKGYNSNQVSEIPIINFLQSHADSEKITFKDTNVNDIYKYIGTRMPWTLWRTTDEYLKLLITRAIEDQYRVFNNEIIEFKYLNDEQRKKSKRIFENYNSETVQKFLPELARKVNNIKARIDQSLTEEDKTALHKHIIGKHFVIFRNFFFNVIPQAFNSEWYEWDVPNQLNKKENDEWKKLKNIPRNKKTSEQILKFKELNTKKLTFKKEGTFRNLRGKANSLYKNDKGKTNLLWPFLSLVYSIEESGAYKKMSATEKESIKRLRNSLRIAFLTQMIAVLSYVLLFSDEDDEKTNMLAIINLRLARETVSDLPIPLLGADDLYELLKDPVVSMRAFDSILATFSAVISLPAQIIWPVETKEKGKFEDVNPFVEKLIKSTPLLNQGYNYSPFFPLGPEDRVLEATKDKLRNEKKKFNSSFAIKPLLPFTGKLKKSKD